MENLLPKGVELIDQIEYVPDNITGSTWIIAIIGLFIGVPILISSLVCKDEKMQNTLMFVSVLTMFLSMIAGGVISMTGQATGQTRDAYKVLVTEETDVDALEKDFDILETDRFVWTIAPKR